MPNIIKITDFTVPELDIFSRLSERQLVHYAEPKPGLFIAESPNVIDRALFAGYEPVSFLVEEKQLTGHTLEILSRFPHIPVYTAGEDVLFSLTGFSMTRGVLCAMRRRPLPAIEEICAGAHRIAILEDVMNPTNVGAIFRSAAALGMDAVLLTPACSDPLYRRAARVSMGTVFQVPWTYFGEEGEHAGWPQPAMALLGKMGFKTAAMALSDRSISIEAPCLQTEEKLAIVLGTEGDGLAAATIADCDYTVRIPMSHGVDSLNVAAASAVAFWQLRSR